MKEEKYSIEYLGKTIYLNENLIIKLNLSEERIKDIKQLHRQAISCDISLTKMVKLDNLLHLADLLNHWHEIQENLQEAWGFPKDRNYHKFWELTSCKCPKMDNEDRYPSGYYVISSKCALHGK
jgi:hypothetical protein